MKKRDWVDKYRNETFDDYVYNAFCHRMYNELLNYISDELADRCDEIEYIIKNYSDGFLWMSLADINKSIDAICYRHLNKDVPVIKASDILGEGYENFTLDRLLIIPVEPPRHISKIFRSTKAGWYGAYWNYQEACSRIEDDETAEKEPGPFKDFLDDIRKFDAELLSDSVLKKVLNIVREQIALEKCNRTNDGHNISAYDGISKQSDGYAFKWELRIVEND